VLPDALAPDANETVYEAVNVRRIAFDNLMWQVPALGLTAQAFLLTITLDEDDGFVARLVAGGLGLAMSIISAQLMLKHRQNEEIDRRLLELMEASNGWQRVHAHPRELRAAISRRMAEAAVARNGDDSASAAVASTAAPANWNLFRWAGSGIRRATSASGAWMVTWKSHQVWIGGLALFGVASIAGIILDIVQYAASHA
jgi:hypothetical protein